MIVHSFIVSERNLTIRSLRTGSWGCGQVFYTDPAEGEHLKGKQNTFIGSKIKRNDEG